MVECGWCRREFIPPTDASKWGFGVEYMVFCSPACFEGHGYAVMLLGGKLEQLEREARLLERIRDAKQAIYQIENLERTHYTDWKGGKIE